MAASTLLFAVAADYLQVIVDRGGNEAYGVAYALFNTAYAVRLVVGPLAGGASTVLYGFPLAMLLAGLFPEPARPSTFIARNPVS